ncbi:SWIM zinc finger family protein [Halococcus sp. AFM35]|uniref:SWIM zinc finger family protein n=1 Tax=Halococcus sp. AFM35 TaxID=3421653 RepID=UPI003EBCB289
MSTNEPSGQESGESTDERRGSEAVAKRVHRALDSFYHVEAAGENSEYTVFSGSGNAYTVSLPEGTCTCPDGQRGTWCKHAHRAAFVTGEIPAIDGVHVPADIDDTEADGEDTEQASDDEPDTDDETLAERVERFETNNPGASAIEAVAQLDIDPSQKERVKEVLA